MLRWRSANQRRVWCLRRVRCQHGAASHAFLDEETVLFFLAQHPGMRADEAVLEFIRRVPAAHYKGSCIYHTKTGCNLPRDMRARICNAYECKGLKDSRPHFGKNGGSRAYVVVRHDNRIMHGAFVDASGTRPYAGASKVTDRIPEA
jgi:hypothetical protein